MTSIRPLIPALRPRERLEDAGPRALHDRELLALLLGNGTRHHEVLALADELLVQGAGTRGLAQSPLAVLARIPGVGPSKGARLVAAFELGRRALEQPPPRRPITRPADLAALARSRIGAAPREIVLAAYLDAGLGLIDLVEIGRGSVAFAALSPRDLVQEGLQRHAAAMVLVHNHPSGDPTPSEQDRSTTRMLAGLARALDLILVDHIILGGSRFHSMREHGELDPDRPA